MANKTASDGQMFESNHDDSFRLAAKKKKYRSTSVFTKRNTGLMARLSLFVVAFVCVCVCRCAFVHVSLFCPSGQILVSLVGAALQLDYLNTGTGNQRAN